jgi:protein phosphatase
MPLRPAFAGCSDIGRRRTSNQDRWCVHEELQLAAVADGMGGMPFGEEAAQAALDALAAHLQESAPEQPAAWSKLLHSVNREVAALGGQLSPATGIGSTLTIARIHAGRLHIAHVGDSALLRLRAGLLEQLTCEHTVASEIRARRAAGHWLPMPARAEHALTSCLGLPRLPEIDVRETDLQAGDRLLLCTDGLTKPVLPQAIRDALASATSPATAAQALVSLANAAGGPDNITVVVAFVEGS